MKTRQNINLNEEEEEQIPMHAMNIHLPFFENTLQRRLIKAYLDEEIREPKYYRPLIQTIDSLTENDGLILNINSYGGDLDGAMALVNAIRNTEAEVHVNIDGVAASSASIIALYSPSIQISPYSSMMIHSASFGSFGKQSDVISHASYVDQRCKRIMAEAYNGFLTAQELAEVLMGREIWFQAEEVQARLEKRAKLLEKELKKIKKSMGTNQEPAK